MGDVIMKQPDGGYHVTDGSNMLGGDYHRTIRASDGTIPEEYQPSCQSNFITIS